MNRPSVRVVRSSRPLGAALRAQAPVAPIGFAATFALSPERAKAVATLLAGTDDHSAPSSARSHRRRADAMGHCHHSTPAGTVPRRSH